MSVRTAAVAGTFYPAEVSELSAQIQHDLSTVSSELKPVSGFPAAIIVPHAGYIYSGQTAAFAYQTIQNAPIRRVALFGPAHRVAFYGMAVPEVSQYETPLGSITIDKEMSSQALEHPEVVSSDKPHALEHSLEVQLPFLQTVLGDFSLLPVCVGMVEPEAVAAVMRKFLQQPEILVVISSDLSHFHGYEKANALDQYTVDAILDLKGPLQHEQACGATGINALMLIAKADKLAVKLLDYRNSGDTAGDKLRVVGYASLGFYAQEEVVTV